LGAFSFKFYAFLGYLSMNGFISWGFEPENPLLSTPMNLTSGYTSVGSHVAEYTVEIDVSNVFIAFM